MTRVYKRAGTAEFHCEGHPIHAGDRESPGEGHHSIVIVWAAGCAHIDEHDPHPLRPRCARGCQTYVLTDGEDPRSAETEEFTDPSSGDDSPLHT